MGILYKLRYFVSINTMKQLYYTLIYPYLNYGLMSWGTACQTRLKRIKIKQNKCLRCIFFANKTETATPYYTLLKILKLENVFNFKISSLEHKIKYVKIGFPATFSDLVLPASEVHNYNTR